MARCHKAFSTASLACSEPAISANKVAGSLKSVTKSWAAKYVRSWPGISAPDPADPTMQTIFRDGNWACKSAQVMPSFFRAEGRNEVSNTSLLAKSLCNCAWPLSLFRSAWTTFTSACKCAYAWGAYKPMGSEVTPLTGPAGGRGSSLVHLAPMSAKRISAAGPGRLSATLNMRTPFKVSSASLKVFEFTVQNPRANRHSFQPGLLTKLGC